MLKRKTHKSEIDVTHSEGFFMVSKDDAVKAITSRLTGSQYRLWHYLMTIDAFADFTASGERIYKDIPSPAECAIAIGSSARTVEKDIRVLRDLKLYDYRVTGWQGHNLSAENAKLESERLKKQKAPEPAQDKGGYLAAQTVKQPDSVLNSRQKGYLAENPNLHNNERAREYSDCIQINSDLNTQEVCAEEKNFSEATPTPVLEPTEPNQSFPNQQTDIILNTSAAAPNSPPRENYIHPTQRCDDRFNRKIYPWRNSESRNDFKEGFIDYLVKTYLPTTAHYQKERITEESAKRWITKREYGEQGLSEIEITWDEYLKSLKPAEKRVSRPPGINQDIWRKSAYQMTREEHKTLLGLLVSLGEKAFLEHHRFADPYLRDVRREHPDLYKEYVENASTSA